MRSIQVALAALLVIPVIAFSSRPLRFGLGVAALLAANPAELDRRAHTLDMERSFFGVSRVLLDPGGSYHNLYHGTTLHGVERVRPVRCRQPLGYYGRTGPLGDVYRMLRGRGAPLSVAVAGLGAGEAAAYAEAGDRWVFYEIDPVVARIARDPRLFCFLSASPAETRIALGDARLSLAASAERYDLLILDAYSSDAIPVHLITREALRLYLEHLAPGGVILFHISNKFFDFAPIVSRLAADAGLVCRIRTHALLTREEMAGGLLPSTYAVMCRRSEEVAALAPAAEWPLAPAPAAGAPWSDDYSSLFAALRR